MWFVSSRIVSCCLYMLFCFGLCCFALFYMVSFHVSLSICVSCGVCLVSGSPCVVFAVFYFVSHCIVLFVSFCVAVIVLSCIMFVMCAHCSLSCRFALCCCVYFVCVVLLCCFCIAACVPCVALALFRYVLLCLA